jgi:hypothetical protein
MTLKVGMSGEGPTITNMVPTLGLLQTKSASPISTQPRSWRPWTTGLWLLLPLTAVISVQFVSVANAAGAGGPPRSPESFGAIELSYCKLPGVSQLARCGSLEVPENPNHPAARQLRMAVAVIPATGGKSLPDPIVILMGGPGEDAIGAAEFNPSSSQRCATIATSC